MHNYTQDKDESVLVFLFLFVSTSLSLAGNSGRLTCVRHSNHKNNATHFSVFSCVQTMVWLPVFGFFNILTDVGECDCTQGLYGHRKSLYWKLTVGEKSLAAPRKT